MNTKIIQSLSGGIVATAIMTMIILVAPMMGMPKMNPAEMLAAMLGTHILVGWMMHLIIGIMFASAYVFAGAGLLRKISNKIVKGAVFGLTVFVFAQIAMKMMSLVMGAMPAPEGNLFLVLLGSIIGHLVYGIVVALLVKNAVEYQTA